MTTIKAFNGAKLTVHDNGIDYGRADLTFEGHSMQFFGNFDLAELLEALDATANSDVKHRADAHEAATKAEARAEAAEAKLGKIADYLECHEIVPMPEKLEQITTRYHNLILDMRAAHAGEPRRSEFVLPTKAGGRFEATSANGNVYQFESVTAFGITYYFANQLVWTANQVMGMFKDHRLIGEQP